MNALAEELKFEEAMVIRNQLRSLEGIDKDLITSLASDSNCDVFGIVYQWNSSGCLWCWQCSRGEYCN